MTTNTVRVVTFRKGVHKYVWIYREENREELYRSIWRFMCNPEIDLDIRDCLQIHRKIRNEPIEVTL